MFNLRVELDHDCFSGIRRNKVIKQVLIKIGDQLEANLTRGPQIGVVKHEDSTVIAHWKIE